MIGRYRGWRKIAGRAKERAKLLRGGAEREEGQGGDAGGSGETPGR